MQTTYHYDALGRVYEKDYTGTASPETVTYQFDSLGRENQITDTVVGQAARLTSFTFDVENRLTSIATPQGTINYGYNDATAWHTHTFTTNSDIVYGYDLLGRLQTVTREVNPRYWDLIHAFGEQTGVPVVVNTSFNDNEPIVCSPEEALNCFERLSLAATPRRS